MVPLQPISLLPGKNPMIRFHQRTIARFAYLATSIVLLNSGLISLNSAMAQLIAFPGAEGAAKLASGGRGGDVYKVTNLNNSGSGSLRDGIQTAPGSGRTIVFDVAGTINLTSSLDFNGKSNITIAGQTAPAGGITIANHRLRINDADNVVVQFLRVRPGNTYGSQDPDAIWVQTSTNVMLDHITASWSVDETISTTHNSDNVTVQWSTLSQGLYDGGHSKGSGHSYGSLINGGTYTYHHNLYSHNKSRHGRFQARENPLELDWVNNVIFNPQDEFGNSDSNDPFEVNMVGNYGIRGPRPGTGPLNLMKPDDDASIFYVEGNYFDSVRDGVVNGSAVDGAAVFEGTINVDYTLSGTRLNPAELPEINTHSASDAYIQVLSRAGAVNYRDPVDRELIRTVMNQTDWSIDTQQDVNINGDIGWPTLPTGSALPDSNNDGVPDTWALSTFGDTTTPLNSTLAPSGYTYLEEYAHSLTPNAYAPTGTVAHTIHTGYGGGSDAQINENNDVSSGDGTGNSLDALWSGASGNNNQMIVLRFDLSEIGLGSVTDARLELTSDAAISGSHQFKVYGLEHDATGYDWDESTVEFDNMTGVTFDSNSGTLGINPTYNSTNPIDVPDLLRLGEFSINGTSADETVSFENPNLEVFLNLAAYFEGEPSEGLVTLILEQINDSSSNTASFYSSEGDALLAPRLVLDAELLAAFLEGDFDEDGDVDDSDLALWEAGYGTTSGATHMQGDANGDGVVDGSDFLTWQEQHTGPIALESAGTAVPEPTSVVLLACGCFSFFARYRHSV